MNPRAAYSMAGSKRSRKGSEPNFRDSVDHRSTAPGTVTVSQPSCGILLQRAKRSGVQASGERPEPFKPYSLFPSQTMAKASLPIPLLVGSTTVNAIAEAKAASTAFPPRSIILSPACAANGLDVATALRANTGILREGYGKSHVKFIP